MRTIKDMGAIRRSRALLFLLVSCSLLGREYGPAVGSKLPAFELPDQDGRLHSSSNLLGPKGAVIVFYRSADW
jgi:hypothetical protein